MFDGKDFFRINLNYKMGSAILIYRKKRRNFILKIAIMTHLCTMSRDLSQFKEMTSKTQIMIKSAS